MDKLLTWRSQKSFLCCNFKKLPSESTRYNFIVTLIAQQISKTNFSILVNLWGNNAKACRIKADPELLDQTVGESVT